MDVDADIWDPFTDQPETARNAQTLLEQILGSSLQFDDEPMTALQQSVSNDVSAPIAGDNDGLFFRLFTDQAPALIQLQPEEESAVAVKRKIEWSKYSISESQH
ncbi:hypothetical protein HDU96_010739 [Phlyctochytrium bullatum]|nr:hypothetical protein HDU96_010739 [Phlyctochytrium bullatum]